MAFERSHDMCIFVFFMLLANTGIGSHVNTAKVSQMK